MTEGGETTMTVPSAGGVDAQWVSQALGTAVEDVEVTPIAVGAGFMSEILRLRITYGPDAGDLPTSLIAKLPSTAPGSVELGQLLRAWEREARFYLDVAPRLPLRTARCHYAGGDEEEGLYALLLEDLGSLVLGDQVAGASLAQAETAIDWLARFHGRAATEPALQDLPWLPDVATDPMYQGLQPMLDLVWPQFVDTYRDCCPGDSLQTVERARHGLSDELRRMPVPPTVVHADFRPDNLFFGGGGELVPVDWQAPARAQGLYDLTYFLTCGLPIELRRAHEHELLQRWADGVRDAGGEVPVELWEEYRRMVLLVMTIGALLMGQLDITVNERAVELGRTTVERMYTAGIDHDVRTLLDA